MVPIAGGSIKRWPLERTPLIGHQQVLEHVRDALVENAGPMLTLTGRGGTGKTRIALASSRHVAFHYPAGVHYAALGTVSDARRLLPAVARAAGLSTRGGPLLGQLADGMTGRRLLILDGFEQLHAARRILSSLLDSCPELTLLITDRWPLDLAGERVIRVPGLPTPARGDDPPTADLLEFPAIELFVTVARARQPAFRLGTANSAAVVEICQRLDGLPLAIELAAGLVEFLDPSEILAHAVDWLAVLNRGTADGPAYQRSLRGSIDRSYRLLAPDEQRMLRRVSTLVGSFTVQAAAGTAGESTGATFATLTALLDKGLLQRAASTSLSFWIPEVIRQYAAEQLIAAGEQARTRQAHAVHFLSVIEPPAQGMPGVLHAPEDAHLPNMRVAMRYFLDNDQPQEALRIAVGLENVWWARSAPREGRNWLLECLDHVTDDTPSRDRAFGIAATMSARLLILDEAEGLARTGLCLARALADPIGMANAGEALGLSAGARGEAEAGHRALNSSIALWQQAGDRARLARSLEYSASGLLWHGDLAGAAHQLERSLRVLREIDDRAQTAVSTTTLGLILTYEGRGAQALAELQHGLDLATASSRRHDIGRAHFGLGLVASRDGRPGEAEDHLARAMAMVAETGDRSFLPGCVLALAHVYHATDRPDDAVRLLSAATVQGRDVGLRPPGLLRVDYEQLMDALRVRMGTPRYEAAWARASRIARDQVLVTQLGPPLTAFARAPDPLTRREAEVLTLVARGLSDEQIGRSLIISTRTVHAHVRSIYRRLGIRTRSAATRYAIEHDLG